MKTATIVIIVACTCVLASAVFTTISLKREVRQLEPKAKKYDEVCGYVKSALHTDRNLLTFDKNTHDRMLADFAGNHIGDGMQMLDWCVPNVKEFVSEIRRCDGLNDDACIDRVFQAMEKSIAAMVTP